MRLVKKDFTKDGSGWLKLVPTETEDMWHAYNLIAVGDVLTTTTTRKVKSESSTGSVDTKKVTTTLTLKVHEIDFDTSVGVLRVSGRTVEQNRFVKLGSHHTLELELHRQFTLQKDCWDTVDLERISEACDPAKSADLAAIVIQEGIARVCLITSCMTLTKATIEVSIPRKRQGLGSQFERARRRFFDQVYDSVARDIDFDVVKCVVLAGPGFTKDEFFEHFQKRAVLEENKTLVAARSKFVIVSASSGYKDALREAMADPSVAARMADTKAARETKAIAEFYKMLDDDADRAYYGYNHVLRANEAQAIDTLMVTDSLFRSADIPTRKKYIALVESARDNGATVLIFSSLHVSGERLAALSGIAAILRYPMPDINDIDQGDDSDSDDSDTSGVHTDDVSREMSYSIMRARSMPSEVKKVAT
eukprot:m.179624 g.179624  ORF g.179624 m.179624 type:complete len:421 (+) comp14811_c0_seq1:251-1513(+)